MTEEIKWYTETMTEPDAVLEKDEHDEILKIQAIERQEIVTCNKD